MIVIDIMHLLMTAFPYLKWNGNWNELITLVEGCSHETRITTVTWKPPVGVYLKLNTDGSALSNPDWGLGGGGGSGDSKRSTRQHDICIHCAIGSGY